MARRRRATPPPLPVVAALGWLGLAAAQAGGDGCAEPASSNTTTEFRFCAASGGAWAACVDAADALTERQCEAAPASAAPCVESYLDPEQCELPGAGALGILATGRAGFDVRVHDQLGRPFAARYDAFVAVVSCSAGQEAAALVEWEEASPTRHRVKYSLPDSGCTNATVTVTTTWGAAVGSPIDVTVLPALSIASTANVSIANSEARGAGLQSATAGETASFVVFLRDKYGMAVAQGSASDIGVAITGLADSAVQVSVTGVGEYTVEYIDTRADTRTLAVEAFDSALSGSPFSLLVAPAAVSALITDVTDVSDTGRLRRFRINAMDEFSNALDGVCDGFRGASPSDDGTPADLTVAQTNEGCIVSVDPRAAGSHTLKVFYGSQALPDTTWQSFNVEAGQASALASMVRMCSSCEVCGCGLASAVAGKRLLVEVIPRDYTWAPASTIPDVVVSITDSTGQDVLTHSFNDSDFLTTGTNTRTLDDNTSLVLNVTGTYSVDVQFDGRPVTGSPFSVRVIADTLNVAEVIEVTEGASASTTVGQARTVSLRPRDVYGNDFAIGLGVPASTYSDLQFEIELNETCAVAAGCADTAPFPLTCTAGDLLHPDATNQCVVSELRPDGTFAVQYLLVVAGEYLVNARSNVTGSDVATAVDSSVVLTVEPGQVSAVGTYVELVSPVAAGTAGNFTVNLYDDYKNDALCLDSMGPCTDASGSCVAITGTGTGCSATHTLSVAVHADNGNANALDIVLNTTENEAELRDNGRLIVRYTANVSGSYALIVTLKGLPLFQTPQQVVIIAAATDPSSCEIGSVAGRQLCSDNGRDSTCSINVSAYGDQFLRVFAKDEYGNVQNVTDEFEATEPISLSVVEQVRCNNPAAANYDTNETLTPDNNSCIASDIPYLRSSFDCPQQDKLFGGNGIVLNNSYYFPADSAEVCARACALRDNCEAMQFVDENKRCYLKNDYARLPAHLSDADGYQYYAKARPGVSSTCEYGCNDTAADNFKEDLDASDPSACDYPTRSILTSVGGGIYMIEYNVDAASDLVEYMLNVSLQGVSVGSIRMIVVDSTASHSVVGADSQYFSVVDPAAGGAVFVSGRQAYIDVEPRNNDLVMLPSGFARPFTLNITSSVDNPRSQDSVAVLYGGMHRLYYTLYIVGTHEISVVYNTEVLQTASHAVRPGPVDTDKSTMEMTSDSSLTAGDPLGVDIQLRDSSNNTIASSTSTDRVELLLETAGEPAQSVLARRSDASVWSAIQELLISGQHAVSSSVNGEAVLTANDEAVLTVDVTAAALFTVRCTDTTTSDDVYVGAGGDVSVTVQASDRFGNLARTSDGEVITLGLFEGNRSVSLQNASDDMTGSYTAVFIPAATGTYSVNMVADGSIAQTFGCRQVVVQPGLASNMTSVPEFDAAARKQVGHAYRFQVQGRDRYNNSMQTGGSVVSAYLEGTTTGAFIGARVHDNRDGTYTLSYQADQARTPDTYNLFVLVGGDPVGHSPYTFVLDPSGREVLEMSQGANATGYFQVAGLGATVVAGECAEIEARGFDRFSNPVEPFDVGQNLTFTVTRRVANAEMIADCVTGYTAGNAATPSTTCPANVCTLVNAAVATCSGTATDPAIPCSGFNPVDPLTADCESAGCTLNAATAETCTDTVESEVVADCVTGYTAGDAATPSTSCPTGCTLVNAVAGVTASAETCVDTVDGMVVATGVLDSAAWSANITVYSAGDHDLEVFFQNRSIFGRRFVVDPAYPSPDRSDFILPPNTSVVTEAGETRKVHVQLSDPYGNPAGQHQAIVVAPSPGLSWSAAGTGAINFVYTQSTAPSSDSVLIVSVGGTPLATLNVSVSPSDVQTESCTLQGVLDITAGGYSSVDIEPRDRFGNILSDYTQNFVVSFRDRLGDVVGADSIDKLSALETDSQHTYRYRAVVSGTYWMFVSLNEIGISGSPFRVNVIADVSTVAATSTLGGEGVTGGVVNRLQVFTITRRDAYDNIRLAYDDTIIVEFNPSIGVEGVNYNIMNDTVTYLVSTAGTYSIGALVFGELLGDMRISVVIAQEITDVSAANCTIVKPEEAVIAGEFFGVRIEPRDGRGILLSPQTQSLVNETVCLAAMENQTRHDACAVDIQGNSTLTAGRIASWYECHMQIARDTASDRSGDWSAMRSVSQACQATYGGFRFHASIHGAAVVVPVFSKPDGTFQAIVRQTNCTQPLDFDVLLVNTTTGNLTQVPLLDGGQPPTPEWPGFVRPGQVSPLASLFSIMNVERHTTTSVSSVPNIITRDEFGNAVGNEGIADFNFSRIDVNLTHDANFTFGVRYAGNGAFDVSFAADVATTYFVNAFIDDVPLHGSPVVILVSPAEISAVTSICTGTGLTTAMVGETATAFILGKDEFGNSLNQEPNPDDLARLHAQVEGPSGVDSAVLVLNIIDRHDGSFGVSYMRIIAGSYRFEVLQGSAHVCDGDITVEAGPPSPMESVLTGFAGQSHVAGEVSEVVVELNDEYGNTAAAASADVRMMLNASDHSWSLPLTVQTKTASSVSVFIVSPRSGTVDLAVYFGSAQHILSPFAATWGNATAPAITEAKMTDDGGSVGVVFDKATDRSGAICVDLLDDRSLGLLGTDPACVWQDAVTLLVTLGNSPTLSLVDTEVLMLTLTLGTPSITAANVDSELATGSVVVQAADNPTPLKLRVSSPAAVGSCAEYMVDCSLSVNPALGQPTFTYSVLGEDAINNAWQTIDDQPSPTGLRAKLPASVMAAGTEYEVVVTMSNAEYGSTVEKSVRVTRYASASLADVLVSGAQERTNDCSTAVVLDAVVVLSLCSDLDPSVVYNWTSSTSPDLVQGLQTNSSRLYVPAHTFAPGSTYGFSVSVAPAANRTDTSSTAEAQVTVVTRYTPLVSAIAGGSRHVPQTGFLILDGSGSYDPSAACGGGSSFLRRWTCQTADGQSCWEANDFGSTDEFSQAGQVNISTVLLKSNEPLTFTQEIYATDVGGRTGDALAKSAAVDVRVVPSNITQVMIHSSAATASGVVLRGEAVHAGSGTEQVSYQWSSQPGLPSSVLMSASALAVPHSLLAEGAEYTFTLTVQESDTIAPGSASVAVQVNAPPSAGAFTVTPLTGDSMSTPFSVLFSSWKDEDEPLFHSVHLHTGGSVHALTRLRTGNIFDSIKLLGSGTVQLVGTVSDVYQAAATRTVDVTLTQTPYELANAREDFEIAKGTQDTEMLCRTLAGLAHSESGRRMLQATNDSTAALIDEALAELHGLITTSQPEFVFDDSALHLQAVSSLLVSLNASTQELETATKDLLVEVFASIASSTIGRGPSHDTMLPDAMQVAETLHTMTRTHTTGTYNDPRVMQAIEEIVYSAMRGQLAGASATSYSSSTSVMPLLAGVSVEKAVSAEGMQSTLLGVIPASLSTLVPADIGVTTFTWNTTLMVQPSVGLTILSPLTTVEMYDLSSDRFDTITTDGHVVTLTLDLLEQPSTNFAGCGLISLETGENIAGRDGASSPVSDAYPASQVLCEINVLDGTAVALFDSAWRTCTTDEEYELVPPTAYNDRVCAPYAMQCPADSVQVGDRSPTSDRICVCGLGFYARITLFGFQCDPFTVCADDEYETRPPEPLGCSLTLGCIKDRMCLAITQCDALPLTFWDWNVTSGIGSCMPHSPPGCGDGNYRGPGTIKFDTLCQCEAGYFGDGRACELIVGCDTQSGAEWIVSEPDTTGRVATGYVCANVSQCTQDSSVPIPSPFENIGTDTYVIRAYTTHSDNVCTCPTRAGEVESDWLDQSTGLCMPRTVCTKTASVSSPVIQYVSQDANSTSDRACLPLTTECDFPREYTSQTATVSISLPEQYITDRVCTAVTVCDANAVQVVSSTAVSDRTCECDFASNFWGDGGTCTQLRACTTNGSPDPANPGSATQNRVCICNANSWDDGATCTACRTCTGVGSTATQVSDCTVTANRECNCNSGHYNTGMGDNIACTPYTSCSGDGLQVMTAGTLSTDQVCECLAEHFRAAGAAHNAPCTVLAPGTTLVNGERVCNAGFSGTPPTCRRTCPNDCSGVNALWCDTHPVTGGSCVCKCGFSGATCGTGRNVCTVDILEVALTNSIAEVPDNTDLRDEFYESFKNEVASAAGGIATSRVIIESITAGSMIVRFRIEEPGIGDPSARTSAAATAQLQAAGGLGQQFTVAPGGNVMTAELAESGTWSPDDADTVPTTELSTTEQVVGSFAVILAVFGMGFVVLKVLSQGKVVKDSHATHANRYASGQAQPVVKLPPTNSSHMYVDDPEPKPTPRPQPVPAPAPAPPPPVQVECHTVTFYILETGAHELVDMDDAHLMTVDYLKKCLVEHGLATAQCELHHNRMPLNVESFTLGEYGIENGATITVEEPAEKASPRSASPSPVPRAVTPEPATMRSVRPVSPPPRQPRRQTSLQTSAGYGHGWQAARRDVPMPIARTQSPVRMPSNTSMQVHALRAAKQAYGEAGWAALGREGQLQAVVQYSQQAQQRQQAVGPAVGMSQISMASMAPPGPLAPTISGVSSIAMPKRRAVTPTQTRSTANGSQLRANCLAIQAGMHAQQQVRTSYSSYQQPPPPSPTTSMIDGGMSMSMSQQQMQQPRYGQP